MAREKPLLAGLAGGVAVLYDPVIAAPFWLAIFLAFIADRGSRRIVRPALPILLVFALLLANLAQLQPGILERQDVFSTIPEPFAILQQYRTPFAWVSLWADREMWHYLAIFVCGLWATARIWAFLNGRMRWFLLALPLFGILSVPVSALLLDLFRWSLIPQIQPARALQYTVMFGLFACAIAGLYAARSGRFVEASLWFVLVFMLPMNVQILDVIHLGSALALRELAVAIAFACTLVFAAKKLAKTQWNAVILCLPVAALFVLPLASGVPRTELIGREPITELSDWAEKETWGSSMFLFPDAGQELDPGIFRAESRRALWVDWQSGTLVPDSESFASEWWQRWRDDVQGGFSPQALENMLSLPIDYYVLKLPNELRNVRWVFRNSKFVVYDASDLRNSNQPLALAQLNLATAEIDTEFLQFFRVIALVQNVVFFAAFRDIALLGLNLLARGFIDALFELQQVCHLTNNRKPELIRVVANPKIARLAHTGNDLVRQLVHAIAGQLHGVPGIPARRPGQFALRHQLVLYFSEHLLVRNVLAPHVIAVIVQQIADLVIQPVFGGKILFDDMGNDPGGNRRIRCFE